MTRACFMKPCLRQQSPLRILALYHHPFCLRKREKCVRVCLGSLLDGTCALRETTNALPSDCDRKPRPLSLSSRRPRCARYQSARSSYSLLTDFDASLLLPRQLVPSLQDDLGHDPDHHRRPSASHPFCVEWSPSDPPSSDLPGF